MGQWPGAGKARPLVLEYCTVLVLFPMERDLPIEQLEYVYHFWSREAGRSGAETRL